MLMVLIWGKQIQFCFFSDRLKDTLTSGCCSQPEFLPGLRSPAFSFLLHFISHFSLWLNMEWNYLSDTVCFEILNCAVDFPEGAVVIVSTFAYLTGFVSLKLTSMLSFLFLFNPCLFLTVLVWSTSLAWIVSFGRDPVWLTMALCAAAPSLTRFRSWQLPERLVSHAPVCKVRHHCVQATWTELHSVLPKHIV